MSELPNSFPAPVKYDRHGPAWNANDVQNFIINDIEIGNYFPKREKIMQEKIIDATNKVNDATAQFSKALDVMFEKEKALADTTKSALGKVRDSVERLHQGMQSVEKTANFDKLERYVGLLERAAVAMDSLAKLHADGKLEKIASALK